MTFSRPLKLFGTSEKVVAPTLLSAGPLEASLDGGNLRYIRIGGREALRGIAFLVRDRNWGTYNPAISGLAVDQRDDGFTVTYDAECRDADQAFRYSARIEGEADGSLVFSAEGEALTDFVTNRTGFVVLHPLAGIVGEPVTVEHTDGRIVESRFPEIIDPMCPFQDVRALTHEVMPGLRATCRMEGDAFEMEDHRNWMDASYKTYVRPLALPWPYTIAKGERLPQRVTLTFAGAVPGIGGLAGEEAVDVSVGKPADHGLPRFGLAVPAESAADALANADLIRRAGPSFLVCHFDPRAGHDFRTMAQFVRLGDAVGAALVLEAVVPCQDADGAPSDDLEIMRRDVAAIGEAAKSAGARFERVAVSPACDLKCTLPGSVFPKAPGFAELMQAARTAFPGIPVGGGMFSYFTELNRKRPPAGALDFICHSGCPIVHAGDDVSLTETLEALPSIFHSVRAFSGGKPYWVLPTAISMRGNPYGAEPAENPDNIRQAMNRVDPRERGLIGAAFYAGYAARAAAAGVDAVTLAAAGGPSSIVYSARDHAQPGFDEGGMAVYPHYHVIAGLADLRGEVLQVESGDPRSIQALAMGEGEAQTILVANLTGETRIVRLSGIAGSGTALVLDQDSFMDACSDPDWRRNADRWPVDPNSVTLGAYAVAEIRFDG